MTFMSSDAARLMKYLNDKGVEFTLINHTPAFTAHQVAAATHVRDREMAKTVLVNADGQYWLAVLRADHRIDERELRSILEVRHLSLAQEGEMEPMFPGCEIGAMPPLGRMYGLPVVVDKALSEDDLIVFNACTHSEAIRMRYEDYVLLEDPIVATFARTEGREEPRWMT